MKVEYISHMGSDLMVVNAARVSLDKESSWATENMVAVRSHLREKDKGLLKYLVHNPSNRVHESPFTHPHATLRVTVPIFVANQLKRHQVGLSLNEVSRRYVNTPPQFYEPKEWRSAPPQGTKQGSGQSTVAEVEHYDVMQDLKIPVTPGWLIDKLYMHALQTYNELLTGGVAPEQARMVLPQAMYTSWYWTGSLLAWSRVCYYRQEESAQAETHVVADMIEAIIQPLFPESWAVLKTRGV